MQKTYTQVAQIKLSHNYFAEGSPLPFQLEPSVVTQRQMQQYDLRLLKRDGAFQLFKGHLPEEAPETGIPGALRLVFGLKADDPLYYNYTNLPIGTAPNEIYWLRNAADRGQRLQAEQWVTENDLVQFAGPIYPYAVPQDAKYAYAYDPLGRLVINDSFADIAPTEYNFNVLDIEWGPLTLGFSESEPDDSQEEIVGDTVIYLPTQAKSEFAAIVDLVLQSDQLFEQANFELSFAARSTIWRYHLIDRSNSNSQIYHLLRNGEDAIYDDPESVTMPDGTTAKRVQLTHPIPLSDQPGEKIELQLFEAPSSLGFTEPLATSLAKIGLSAEELGIPTTIQLPLASATNLMVEQGQNGKVFYSDIYLYL